MPLDAISEPWGPCLSELTRGFGRRERVAAMRLYVRGLLLTPGPKTLRNMANTLGASPSERDALRQRMQQLIATASWPDATLRGRVIEHALRVVDQEACFVVQPFALARSRRPVVQGTVVRLVREEATQTLDLEFLRTASTEELESDAAEPTALAQLEPLNAWQLGLRMLAALPEEATGRLIIAPRSLGVVPSFRAALFATHRPFLLEVTGDTVLYGEDEGHRRSVARVWGRGQQSNLAKLDGSIASARVTDRHEDIFHAAALHWDRTPQLGTEGRFWISRHIAPERISTLISQHSATMLEVVDALHRGGFCDYAGRTWQASQHHVSLCLLANLFRTPF